MTETDGCFTMAACKMEEFPRDIHLYTQKGNPEVFDRSGVRLCDGPDLKLFILVGRLVFCSGLVIRRPCISIVGKRTESVEPSFLIHQNVYYNLFVCP